MEEFAAVTGLHPPRESPRRYLWTDAFAVWNLLGLHEATGDEAWRTRAQELVTQVHETLGRFRSDDPDAARRGKPLSGSAEHPTAAGLRIGKGLPERREGEAFDERLEWDRDGQYYHYLTKWMHALTTMTGVTNDDRYAFWAQELARGIHPGFVHGRGNSRSIYWKMSIDLSRPLVPAIGHHDPLDGFITLKQLAVILAPPRGLDLDPEIDVLRKMLVGRDWATNDPLGLGGILCDAYRLLQLLDKTGDATLRPLFVELLGAAARGLDSYAAMHNSHEAAAYRLPFREFGLSIGLQAAEATADSLRGHEAEFGPDSSRLIEMIARHQPIAADIHEFWGQPENQAASTWIEHGDINAVMWATTLLPHGFLDLHLKKQKRGR
jgi:hypothetical protein